MNIWDIRLEKREVVYSLYKSSRRARSYDSYLLRMLVVLAYLDLVGE